MKFQGWHLNIQRTFSYVAACPLRLPSSIFIAVIENIRTIFDNIVEKNAVCRIKHTITFISY
jgi:hypothetical protein